MEGVDFTAWLGSIGTVAGVIVAIVALRKSSRATAQVSQVTPNYAIVSSDGRVLRHSGFALSGICVRLDRVPVSQDKPDKLVPEYTLTFDELPEYFEVTTMEGAVVGLEQRGPKEFSLRFVNVGFGNSTVQCNFRIHKH